MPQKSRSQKERAAARREAGPARRPIASAPIELEAPETNAGMMLNVPPAAPRRVANVVTMLPRGAEAEFNYSYVYSDLRRIALLAILCFAVMVALAFVFR